MKVADTQVGLVTSIRAEVARMRVTSAVASWGRGRPSAALAVGAGATVVGPAGTVGEIVALVLRVADHVMSFV